MADTSPLSTNPTRKTTKAPGFISPALWASCAWISCSEGMSEPTPTSPAFGLASRRHSHIEAPFSLFAAFGLLHLSPKGILLSALVHFATIPRSRDWSSGCCRSGRQVDGAAYPCSSATVSGVMLRRSLRNSLAIPMSICSSKSSSKTEPNAPLNCVTPREFRPAQWNCTRVAESSVESCSPQ